MGKYWKSKKIKKKNNKFKYILLCITRHSQILVKLQISQEEKNSQISNLITFGAVGAELFVWTDRRIDRCVYSNSQFSYTFVTT
jgi:hypothetical protein